MGFLQDRKIEIRMCNAKFDLMFLPYQGLKRLMTFCQKKFPADPSKSVEYNAVK